MSMGAHLVESLVKLGELSSLGHESLVHEERGLDLLELALLEEVKSVRDHGLVQIDSISRQEVSSVTSDLGTYSIMSVWHG
jgi:hypothetical protein